MGIQETRKNQQKPQQNSLKFNKSTISTDTENIAYYLEAKREKFLSNKLAR